MLDSRLELETRPEPNLGRNGRAAVGNPTLPSVIAPRNPARISTHAPHFFYFYVCVHVCVLACEGQTLTLGVFLSDSPPYFLRQGISLNTEFTDSARMAGHELQGPFCLPKPQCYRSN